MKIPIIIGFYTGMRLGEILALNWNDIDFENKTITINKTLVKMSIKGVNSTNFLSTPKTLNSNRMIFIGDNLPK